MMISFSTRLTQPPHKHDHLCPMSLKICNIFFIIPLNKFSCFFIIKNKKNPWKKIFFNQCARAFHSNPQYEFIHDKECWMESTGGKKILISSLSTPLFYMWVPFSHYFLCALFLFGFYNRFVYILLASCSLHTFCTFVSWKNSFLFFFIWIFISVLLQNICELYGDALWIMKRMLKVGKWHLKRANLI